MNNTTPDKFPLLSTPPSIPWLQDIADQYFIGDIDGDGYDEIIIYNPLRKSIAAARNFGYGELTKEWVNDKQRKLITFWHSSGGLFATKEDKGFILGNQISIYFADLDGDGQNEVIIQNIDELQIVVMKWGKNENGYYQFNQLACFKDKFKDNYSVAIDPAGQLYFADIGGNGAAHMMILTSSTNVYFNTFEWDSSEKDFVNINSSTNTLDSNSPTEGNLLGEVKLVFAEIFNKQGKTLVKYSKEKDSAEATLIGFRFNKYNQWSIVWNKSVKTFINPELMVANFASNEKSVIILEKTSSEKIVNTFVYDPINGFQSIDEPIAFPANADLSFADLDGDGMDEIISFNSINFAVFRWGKTKDSGFRIYSESENLGGNWHINNNDKFYFGKFSDKNKLDTLAIKISGYFHGFLIWTKESDTNLSCYNVYNVSNYIRSYDIALIAEGPAKLFSEHPFTDQQAIFYEYISKSVNSIDKNYVPIRETYNKYINNGYREVASKIKELAPPPGTDKDNSDWIFVTTTLINELHGCIHFQQQIKALHNRITDTQLFMDLALSNIEGVTFKKPEDHQDGVLYWFEQLFIAALWGVSSALDGGASVAVSIGASILGSVSSEFTDDGKPIKIKWSKYQSEIYYKMITARGSINNNFFNCFNDWNKLPLLGQLLIGPWNTPLTNPNQRQIDLESIRHYQIYFYQQILPAIPLYILYYRGPDVSFPPPSYDSFTPNPDGRDNYTMTYDYKSIELSSYPDKSLPDDLFKNLKVDVSIFYYRRLGWSRIPLIN